MDEKMEEGVFLHSLTLDTLFTCILMGLIALVGLAGNALMVRAIICYRKLRTDFYIVFAALSIADSIFLVISVPAQIIDMLEAKEVTTDSWCKASHYMMNAFGFIAAFLVVVLALLRGIMLTNRNTISRPQPLHLMVVCAVIFLLALLSSIPILKMYKVTEETSFFCDVYDDNIVQETWLINSFSSFIPLFLVLIIYLMTYCLGKRYFSDSYSPREKGRSRLVTSIIAAFAICQLPYRIVAIYWVYIPELEDNDEIEKTLTKMYTVKNYLMCLMLADKAIRPVLYSKLASDLSEAFDEVINCTYCYKQYSMAPTFDNAYSISGSSCGACAAGSFHATWSEGASPWDGGGGGADSRGASPWQSQNDASGASNLACTVPSCETPSHTDAAEGLGDMEDKYVRAFGRAVSTSSSGSATSQVPLIKTTQDDNIEML